MVTEGGLVQKTINNFNNHEIRLMRNLNLCRLLSASVKNYCVFDLSHCLVQTTKHKLSKLFMERFLEQMKEREGEEETDGKQGIIMSRDINFFGCL